MYKVEIVNNGGSSFQVKSKEYEFSVDTGGKGITPPDALLASLGSCIGVYIHKYFAGSNFVLPSFTVNVEAEFSQEKPACFRQIKVMIDLKGQNLDIRRRNALLEFIRNCPVHNTLKTNPQVNIEIL